MTFALTPPPAEARHGHVGIGAAVGLASAAPFIIVGSILAPLVHQPPVYAYPPPMVERPVVVRQPVYAAPAYAPPPPAYASQTVALGPPPGSYSTTVQYPHGRYELRDDGVFALTG